MTNFLNLNYLSEYIVRVILMIFDDINLSLLAYLSSKIISQNTSNYDTLYDPPTRIV